jgi:hypothetical protein
MTEAKEMHRDLMNALLPIFTRKVYRDELGLGHCRAGQADRRVDPVGALARCTPTGMRRLFRCSRPAYPESPSSSCWAQPWDGDV